MSKSRVAATIGGVGLALLSLVLDHIWKNLDPWVVWLIAGLAILLILISVFWPGLQSLFAKEKPTVGGNIAETNIRDSSMDGDVTNVGGDQTSILGGQGQTFGRVDTVIINNFGPTSEAKLETTEAENPVPGAFIDFYPKNLFATGSSSSIGPVSNVASIASTITPGSTDLAFTFKHPLDNTSYEVTPVGGMPDFKVSEIKRGSVKLTFDGAMPDKLVIKIEDKSQSDEK